MRPEPARTIAVARAAIGERRRRVAEAIVQRTWEWARRRGAIGPHSEIGRRFGAFGERSVICFPPAALLNVNYVHIGEHTMIGPDVTLSAGIAEGQQCVTDPVVRIGNRCVIGKSNGIVGHLEIVIGDDVWTGHNVYITDQNHDYRDLARPIGAQSMPEQPVHIGNGSWIGYGSIVLPGARIGDHVVIAANSVVRGEIPSYSVAAGAPARVVKQIT